MSAAETSILILQGDAEAQWLADADEVIQLLLPDREVRVTRAWMVRPDWLDATSPAPPAILQERGIIQDLDARDLLEYPHNVVVFSFLPTIALPALQHRSGAAFLAHRGVVQHWSARDAALMAEECAELPPLSAQAAANAFEPIIEHLQGRGQGVAITTAFRHVQEPLMHCRLDGPPSLREKARQTNLEVARLSRRTGCFVLDFDRPLAQEGGAALGADCFGGGERAAELAMDEFAALVLDMLPPVETL